MPEPWPGTGEVHVYRVDARGRLVPRSVPRAALDRVRLPQRRRYGHPPAEGNLVVRGDCLLALAGLRERLAGRVQLVYADPPYNTGRGGRRYDDALDRTLWLEMLQERLAACRALLRRRGWLFLHLDATRLGEAQARCDEVFGRENFAHLITWERMPPAMTFLGQGAADLVTSTEFLLVYARDRGAARLQRGQREVEATDRVLRQYDREVRLGRRRRLAVETGPGGRPLQIDRYPRATVLRLPRAERLRCFDRLYQSTRVHPDSSLQRRLLARLDPDTLHGVTYTPTRGKRAGQQITVLLYKGRQLWPARENAHVRDGRVWRRADLTTLWTNEEISAVGTAPEGGVKLVRGKKPEALLARVLALASLPGDLVLDPFAGSGTTAAVALKLGRRFVTCEIADQAGTLVVPRLRRVVRGADASGVTSAAGWAGGGGFRVLEAVLP